MSSDLPLSDELFTRFRDLLLARAGLYYAERRRADLNHGLSQAAQAGGYRDLSALFSAVVAGGAAWELMIAHLTIGETYFFRNGAQFAALRERILPDLLARRAGVKSLRLWSAGCATGEEPYSLAMALTDTLPVNTGWQVSILATDINVQFLERAREALYGAWSFRETPAAARERYFSIEGPRWRLRPELRRQVLFARLNLAETSYPSITNGTVALDLIFCRNVTIYFDETTTRQVIERFYGALAPGGWLVVGHAEPHTETYKAFETHNFPGAVLYRKPLSAPAFMTISADLPPVALPPPRLQPLKGASSRAAPAQATAFSISVATPAPLPPPPPDPLEIGKAAANKGDWAAARAAAERAVAAMPMQAAAHYLLGQVLEHTSDLDRALGAYRRSVYLDPTWVLGTLGMAGIWQRTGSPIEARRAYRGALQQLARLAPDDVVPGSDGASAAELTGYARTQLELLG